MRKSGRDRRTPARVAGPVSLSLSLSSLPFRRLVPALPQPGDWTDDVDRKGTELRNNDSSVRLGWVVLGGDNRPSVHAVGSEPMEEEKKYK